MAAELTSLDQKGRAMTAILPLSLPDGLSPVHVLGSIAGNIAESAKGHNGLAGAFSDAWMGLDANKDGTLNGKDVLSHAVGLRDAVLQGIADGFGYDTGPAARAARESAAEAAETVRDGARRTVGQFKAAATPPAQMLLASAPPALPSDPAARAVENLPGIAQIRATYAALRAAS